MQQKELIYLIIFISIFLVIFIAGSVLYILHNRNRKIEAIKEKEKLQVIHQKEILSTQLEIQTQTMQHIGREIHDNVGQKLTLASLYSNQLDGDELLPQQKEKITKIGSIINESLAELRSLSKSLTSNYMAETPLAELLHTELTKVQLVGSVNIVQQIAMVRPVTVLVKTIVVRIVQEFLQNSLKHAACKNIIFELKETMAGLEIAIHDDGKGFNTTDNHSGIGLYNMKRRAEMIHGKLAILSEPGKGTSLSLFIPENQVSS